MTSETLIDVGVAVFGVGLLAAGMVVRLTPEARTRLRGQLRRPAIWWLLGALVVGVFILPLIVVAMVD